ncbi:MAG TPA: Rieske 2Fe-2S domain-containing protein, partial [Chloroflexota bacterium]|nr:Rieske 2Fe-2S domain-containing protein [Chloroflexota bacterium]
MLSREENELLTRVGPGTPCGAFLRSFWQPAALSEELPPGGPPIPLRLMGEDLVMFRDEHGEIGLLDLHCSHRATDLSYGRIEDGGLRCIYHGWLYDINGNCLETPNEPKSSNLRLTVRHPCYPCREAGGVIFTYM